MKNQHPIDKQIKHSWDELISRIEALFDESPYKGSQFEDEARMFLATALIPDQFQWEPVFTVGGRVNFALVGYCPEIEEVTSEAALRKHGFIIEQPGRLN